MVNTGFRFVRKAGSKSVGHECLIQDFEIVGHVWDVNGQMVNTGFRFVGKAGSKSVGHECSIQVLKSWVVNGHHRF